MTLVSGVSLAPGVSSAGTVAPYLGFVANRGKVPDSTSGSAQSMSVIRCIAMDNISAIRSIVGAYTSAGGVETGVGSTLTYRESIEYPLGTSPTHLTYAGQTSGLCPSATNLQSDITGLPVLIPRGAAFNYRQYQTSPGNIVFCGSAGLNFASAAVYDQWQAGASVPDLTSSTAMPAGNVGSNLGMQLPIALIGYTTRPSILICGDSRSIGGSGHELYTNAVGCAGETQRVIGKWFGCANASASGETMAEAAGGALNLRSLLYQYCSHAVIQYGINDFTSGQTAAQVLANLYTFAGLIGKPVFACTVSPKSTSTDGWGTLANQAVDATSNTNRISFDDTLRRGGWKPPIVDIIDIASVTEAGGALAPSGLWIPAERTATTDLSITTGTSALTSGGVAKFTPADVGKKIAIPGAGAAGAVLSTFINLYTSATAVTTGANAGTTVAGVTGYIGVATDDGLHAAPNGTFLLEASNVYINAFAKILSGA